MLVVITGMALAYRFTNPQHVTFTFTNLGGISHPTILARFISSDHAPSSCWSVRIRNGLHPQKPKTRKVVPRRSFYHWLSKEPSRICSNIFGAEAWMNNSYTITSERC